MIYALFIFIFVRSGCVCDTMDDAYAAFKMKNIPHFFFCVSSAGIAFK